MKSLLIVIAIFYLIYFVANLVNAMVEDDFDVFEDSDDEDDDPPYLGYPGF